jgi:hypothetical protein
LSFEYIKSSELLTTYTDAKRFMRPLFEPFDEYERISRNRPHPGIDKRLPKVTDGTLASLIKEDPKRVIQQIPTGKIEADDEWMELVAQHILADEILPNADEEAKFIAKCWAAVSKSKIYGSQPAFVKFLNRADYFGTDFVLPYIRDVFLEPGKVSDRASNVIMLNTWWSKNQIEALIAKHKKLGDNAGWDLKVLSEMLEEKPGQKESQSQTPSERTKQLSNGLYQITHVFQRGIGANFYSFSPRLDDGNNVVRTKVNPDPRGVIPIHYMYADQDLSNPLGVGAVEMSGGLQNLLDSMVQMYQYNRALMLNPPLKKWGNTPKANIKFVPNHIIELGSKAAGDDVEPLTIDTSAIASFPQDFGLIKSEILNLNNSIDTSVSAEVGNPGFSKTDAGVKAQGVKLGVGDNHTRKQFESWFEEVTETAVNLYFAERHGVQELTLDDEVAYKLRQLQPGAVSEDNKIRVDYDSETPKLKFKVDASSSDKEDSATQLAALDGLLERYEKSQQLQGIIPPDKITQVWNRIVSASGVEDPEKLSVQMDAEGNPKDQMPQQQPQMQPEMVQQMIDQSIKQNDANSLDNHPIIKLMSSLNIKFTDLDADTQRQLIYEIFGIESTGPLPSEVNQVNQATDTHLKADQQAHTQAMDAAKLQHEQDNNLHDQGIKLLDMTHQQSQDQNANDMNQAQFAHTVNTADQSHQLAVKAANKPQPTKGAK